MFYRDHHSHVDFLAYHPSEAHEHALLQDDEYEKIPSDDELFNNISNLIGKDAYRVSLGAIIEVKGNQDIEIPDNKHLDYAINVFGKDAHPCKISFTRKDLHYEILEDSLLISLKDVINYIYSRFDWMNDNLALSKTMSWNLSEDNLSDLLLIHSLE
jgi:hypothetical protein